MEIIEILAIIFAVLCVALGLAFIGAKNKHERAQIDADSYRRLYTNNLAELDRAHQDKNKMEIAWAKAEREYRELDAVWLQQIEMIRRQQSQIDALTELWRHSAARAFDLDEECTANRILYERTANERDTLNRVLAGTSETLFEVGNISEERQQRIQAYEQQQRVSDGNVQRLEAERDEAVQARDWFKKERALSEKDRNAVAAELCIVEAERDEAKGDIAAHCAMARGYYDAAMTQRRHNDTLNAVQARLMRERDEAVADWVSEHGCRTAWEQTAGELEWETKRLQTALEVQQNAVTRLDAQLVRARANDTGRDPQTGQFVKRGKK